MLTIVTTERQRFDLLDGIRGIAALAVMVYHFADDDRLNWLPGAWAAVDLFFVLSGFVIMHSYGTKILNGMTFRQFARSRVLRLAPLYIVGSSLGLMALSLSFMSGREHAVSLHQIAAATILNGFALPYFNNLSWPFGTRDVLGVLFPFNAPAWSLFFEFAVNGVFFAWLRRFGRPPEPVVVGITLAFFAAASFLLHIDNPGWGGPNFIWGVPRVISMFALGVLIYTSEVWRRAPNHAMTILVAILAGAMAFAHSSTIAVANTLTLLPMLIALAAAVRMRGAAMRVCAILGDFSFPIYVLHFPVYRLCFELAPMTLLTPVEQIAFASALTIAAAATLTPIDARLRRGLAARKLTLLRANAQ